MLNLPDRRILLRWMFAVLGFMLMLRPQFVLASVLHADFWGTLLFGEDTPGYRSFMAAAKLYFVPTALLCWIAAAGLRNDKRWSYGVGICACILLLIGFPGLTIAGAIGLYVLIPRSSRPIVAAPAPGEPSTDFWSAKRKSKAQPIVLTALWILAFPLQVWFSAYARRAGMPGWHPAWGWLWFGGFILVNVAIHEAGHAFAAVAAGYRLHIVSIGPISFSRDHSRLRFRFDPTRLFENGGYIGATPVSDRNQRLKEIAVVAAGPAANALAGLVFLAVFVSLPGTAWQNWWWMAALNAFLGCGMAVTNLIPLAYSDGTMLLHLIRWTPAGRLLLERKRVSQMTEAAEACHGRAAFDEEIEVREAMLQRALSFGKDNAFTIAVCHQALGTAYLLVDDWPAAEVQYRKCLACAAEISASPGLAANAWSGLQLTSTRRHRVAAAGPAYAAAVAVLEREKAAGRKAIPDAVKSAMLGQAHLRHGAFREALREFEKALLTGPDGPRGIFLRAYRIRSKAVCQLQLGDTEAGLATAQSAAGVYRSPAIPLDRRNLAWENLADLGYELWRVGQPALAIDRLREGISGLESGGAGTVGARYRIILAAILRQLGRTDEAWAEFPAEQAVCPARRRGFLAERARLHLAAGHQGFTIADCRELVALWRAHPDAPAPEIACAEALLAEACLAAGEFSEAATLATQARDVLGPWQHPDAASCLITLALARWQSTGELDAARTDEAFHLIESAPLLGSAEKQRLRQGLESRLDTARRGARATDALPSAAA